LYVVEKSTRQLLVQDLNDLPKPRLSKMDGRGMVFFPRDSFRLEHTFTEEEVRAAEEEVRAELGRTGAA
jgi:hypothetical protein